MAPEPQELVPWTNQFRWEMLWPQRRFINAWPYGKIFLARMMKYVQALEWPGEGDELLPDGLSFAAMAVDFEVCTGTQLPVNVGRGGRADWRMPETCSTAAAVKVTLADKAIAFNSAWSMLATAFAGPFWSGDHTMVLMRRWGLSIRWAGISVSPKFIAG